MRDSQRSKVYKAEREGLKSFSKPVPTVEDVKNFTQKTFNKPYITRRYGRHTHRNGRTLIPAVADGRGTSNAYAYGDWKISIPVWGRQEWVILHELAHILTHRKYNGRIKHNWQFCAVYLDLVRGMMGAEAHKALKEAFRKHKVRFKEKTTRVITDEQREILKARMAHARACRKK